MRGEHRRDLRQALDLQGRGRAFYAAHGQLPRFPFHPSSRTRDSDEQVSTVRAAECFFTRSHGKTRCRSRRGDTPVEAGVAAETQSPQPACPRLTPTFSRAVVVRNRWGSAPPHPGEGDQPRRGQAQDVQAASSARGCRRSCREPQPTPLFRARQVALHHLPGRHASSQLWGPPLHLGDPQWPADGLRLHLPGHRLRCPHRAGPRGG